MGAPPSVAARAKAYPHVTAARQFIVGILSCQYEQTLVTRSRDGLAIDLHKRVYPHKHGLLGSRRPEQRKALATALTELTKEGLVRQEKLPGDKMALTLTRKPNVVRNKERTQPKRRASTTRKKAA